jgi:endothelin-converting enzyme/putative endopeptidase
MFRTRLPLATSFLLGATLLAQTPDPPAVQPLTSLPYTPSLDLASMDRAADPCVNFFQYACGTWNKINPIPPDQARWEVYSKLADDNMRFLWGILQQAAEPRPGRTAVEQKIGDYFAACMDENTVNAEGAKPLQDDLKLIASMRTTRDLAPVVAKLQMANSGSSFLFGFGSNQDYDDSNKVIAFATAGGLGLPDRDYYTKTDAKSEETRQKYLAHVQSMFELLGDSPATASAEAKTVLSFETALAKASLTRVDQRDPYKLKHKLTRMQLKALTPSFEWDKFLADTGLWKMESLNVTEPKFFEEVQAQIKSQSLDTWKTYLRWHAAHARAAYLSTPFVAANFDFYSKYLRGTPQMQPRWKRCVRLVDGQLGEALGQAFVAKTFGPDVKQRTVDMTKHIELAMESEIEKLDWMSPETKKQALAKLHTIVNKVGYPDKWRDYKALEIKPGDFAGNVARANSFETKRDIAKIGKPVDRGEWGMTPPTVNAYYNPQMNDINFPAGVLQPPLFDAKMDDAPNYGNTGATIGHELTHGFDDEGRQFDARGNLKDWWTKKDADEFEKRVKCVSDQYAQYTVVDDVKINSKLTLGEDVADLGGTLLGYIAWKSATAGKNLESVDGFTPDQRYFIGMAQWACGDERPESKRLHAITDPHSPNEYRINGVVANMPEFAKAFACKVGQPMVRENACKIW